MMPRHDARRSQHRPSTFTFLTITIVSLWLGISVYVSEGFALHTIKDIRSKPFASHDAAREACPQGYFLPSADTSQNDPIIRKWISEYIQSNPGTNDLVILTNTKAVGTGCNLASSATSAKCKWCPLMYNGVCPYMEEIGSGTVPNFVPVSGRKVNWANGKPSSGDASANVLLRRYSNDKVFNGRLKEATHLMCVYFDATEDQGGSHTTTTKKPLTTTTKKPLTTTTKKPLTTTTKKPLTTTTKKPLTTTTKKPLTTTTKKPLTTTTTQSPKDPINKPSGEDAKESNWWIYLVIVAGLLILAAIVIPVIFCCCCAAGAPVEEEYKSEEDDCLSSVRDTRSNRSLVSGGGSMRSMGSSRTSDYSASQSYSQGDVEDCETYDGECVSQGRSAVSYYY